MDRVGDKTIGLVLLIAFRTRYKEVLIKAHTAFAVAPTFLSLLTEEEVKRKIPSLSCFKILLINLYNIRIFTMKCTRQLSLLQWHLRSGGWAAQDLRKLLFLGEKESLLSR